jgi:hypothetical protein
VIYQGDDPTKAVSKNKFMEDLRADLARIGVQTQDADGTERFGTHGVRRGTAQAMARAGWAEVTIQKFLRWESAMVALYVAEAPLALSRVVAQTLFGSGERVGTALGLTGAQAGAALGAAPVRAIVRRKAGPREEDEEMNDLLGLVNEEEEEEEEEEEHPEEDEGEGLAAEAEGTDSEEVGEEMDEEEVEVASEEEWQAGDLHLKEERKRPRKGKKRRRSMARYGSGRALSALLGSMSLKEEVRKEGVRPAFQKEELGEFKPPLIGGTGFWMPPVSGAVAAGCMSRDPLITGRDPLLI